MSRLEDIAERNRRQQNRLRNRLLGVAAIVVFLVVVVVLMMFTDLALPRVAHPVAAPDEGSPAADKRVDGVLLRRTPSAPPTAATPPAPAPPAAR